MKILKHQKLFFKNIKFQLKKKKRGILLFHSLGTGKTIAALFSIKKFIKFYKIKHIYIIAPNYLFPIWKNESQKLSINSDKYFTFIDINNINDIINTIKPSNKKLIIIDEAHIILSKYIHCLKKNNKNKIKQLYKTLYSCYFTIYITATPIIQNVTDLNIFENLCSNKRLLTNDKNLYPEYYNVNFFLYYLFNKIFPFLIKYTFKAPYFTIINIITTFTIIYIELYHDSFFDDFHKFMSYLKYKNDFIGKNVFLPIKKQIEESNDYESNINYEEEIKKDEEYIKYKKKYLKEDIKREDGKLSNDYKKLKKKMLLNTKISYFLKITFSIYYSILTIIELIRNYYVFNNKIVSFNYTKFLKNITSVDKYTLLSSNKYFPQKINHSIYIELNLEQTSNIVKSIINKDYIINNCNPKNDILCDLYNINYDDIPIEKILQISNLFKSDKFNILLDIIKEYKSHCVISCRYIENSLDLICLFLKKHNILYAILKPNRKNNSILIENFENEKIQVLLLHPEIIEGITIKKTKALILFDVCTKYNVEQQIIGRCIRFNSHKNVPYKEVNVYKFVTTFNRRSLMNSLRKIKDPSQSFDELLRDKKKLKFLTSFKTGDQIYEESNLMIEKIYNNL